jgi:Cytochrome c554 and c-prime
LGGPVSGSFRVKSGDKLRAGGAILLLICVVLAPIALSQALTSPASNQDQPPPISAYTGDAACAKCHRKEAAAYEHTPHARDSSPASAKNILGSFQPGDNVLHTLDPNLVINMVAASDSFYQSAVNLANPAEHLAERFDIVIGTGRHGQSYLYWDNDQLYQLPASYFTADHEWIISPSFPADKIMFDRPITPRCLECHSSYFTSIVTNQIDTNQVDTNHFEKSSLVLGINCERCHGPGAAHVTRESASTKPGEAKSRLVADHTIVNPAHLDRDRQLDLCSLCHAGAVNPLRPSLTFRTGDDIRQFLAIKAATPGETVDVHGNQAGALELSKCFTSSKMTCSSCHNVHEGPGVAASYSHYCLECHQMRTCGKYASLGEKIRNKCVDCHMPIQQSGLIVSFAGGQPVRASFRTHQIAIYDEASERVEQSLAGK